MKLLKEKDSLISTVKKLSRDLNKVSKLSYLMIGASVLREPTFHLEFRHPFSFRIPA